MGGVAKPNLLSFYVILVSHLVEYIKHRKFYVNLDLTSVCRFRIRFQMLESLNVSSEGDSFIDQKRFHMAENLQPI